MKQRYALRDAEGRWVKEFDGFDRFNITYTNDIHRAYTATYGWLKRDLDVYEGCGLSLVPVEIQTVITGKPVSANSFMEQELAYMKAEFDELDSMDIDDLSESDFQRWRRLTRLIKERSLCDVYG